MINGEFRRPRRAAYLIRGGAVISVDPAIGTLPRADVLIRDGVIAQIGPRLDADGAEIIDATRMIVMPGFVDFPHAYVEHAWTQFHF